MKNRESLYPGRVKLTTVDEANGIYDMERADQPVEEGTPLNKRLLDFAVAACGVTSGTSTAFTLDDEFGGFELVDGAKVNFKLHVDPQGAATLNVNGTGDKPLLTSRGSPALIGQSEGDWVTAVYSELKGAYLVSGGGLLPQIIVSAAIGTPITVTDGTTTLTVVTTEQETVFDIPNYGKWDVKSNDVTYVTFAVDTVKRYYGMVASTTLNDNSWSTISSVSQTGVASSCWSVGDCKAVSISGTVGTQSISGTYYVYILGFDHNGATGTIDFGTFKTAASGGTDICLVDSYYSSDGSTNKCFNMNHSSTNTNSGGWKGCDLRYDVLGSTKTKGSDAATDTATSPVSGTLMAALPSDLRAVMKPMTIYTDNTGGGTDTASNVTTSVDYLPLLAEFEIFGTRSYANSAEKNYQKQYTYFSSGNSKVKYQHSATGSTANWWERSPSCSNSIYFCLVSTGGNASSYGARYSSGLAPAFRV